MGPALMPLPSGPWQAMQRGKEAWPSFMSAALSGAAVARREVARKRVVIAFMILSWADINGGGSVDLSTRVSSEKFRRFPLYLAGGGDAGVLGTGGREEN